jgi:hypothetical protein
MARFGTKMTRTASASYDVGSLIAAASGMRRFKVFDWLFGSDASPDDSAFLWEIGRQTSTATGGSAPALVALDPGDTLASTVVGNQAPSANGTHTASTVLLSIPLNRRATFRWVAAQDSELVAPATASNGFYFATPTCALVAVQSTVHFKEL